MDATSSAMTSSVMAREWPTQALAYDFIGRIGHGAFATVWKARNKEDQRYCAVKVLNLDHVDTNLSEIRLEVQAMKLSSHPNILTCHTAFVNDTQLWLVTPLMDRGSSLFCLQSARNRLRQEGKPFSMEPHIFYIIHETILGLQYIHANGQIHRDIKAGNILLDSNGDVKIADFGVSGWLVQGGSQMEKAKTFVGTPCWMAPEVMEQVHGYDYKADIWSIGITALELAKGYAPYAKYPPMKVLIMTIQDDPPSLDTYDDEDEEDAMMSQEQYSYLFDSFVSLCLQKNPMKRPTCPELLQSKFLLAYSDPGNREQARQNLQFLCSLIGDVGSQDDSRSAQSRHIGNTPVSIVLSQGKDRPAGTTWVFSDGSQVLSSTATSATVDEVMAELDEFEKQTGGENYAGRSGVNNNATIDEEEGDDLDAFMDEFEQNTAGEDFRR
jgi:serine/threonine-protein kinase OSR1/STK39